MTPIFRMLPVNVWEVWKGRKQEKVCQRRRVCRDSVSFRVMLAAVTNNPQCQWFNLTVTLWLTAFLHVVIQGYMLPLSQALSYPKGLGALCIEQADKGQEKGEVPATSSRPQPGSDPSLPLPFSGRELVHSSPWMQGRMGNVVPAWKDTSSEQWKGRPWCLVHGHRRWQGCEEETCGRGQGQEQPSSEPWTELSALLEILTGPCRWVLWGWGWTLSHWILMESWEIELISSWPHLDRWGNRASEKTLAKVRSPN